MCRTCMLAAASAMALCGAAADPYLWLEEIESPKALAWAKAHNEKTLARLTADPRYSEIEAEVRKILLAKDRLPIPRLYGGAVYNFWQDADHVRGIWRRTSLTSYATASPDWETVLDLDQLAKNEKENWVWHGADCLAPEYTRCLLNLSRGGKDAGVAREFDVKTKSFVAPAQGGFEIPEAKSTAAWVDRDTLLVGTDFGPGSMTKSGYPRILKQWKRGTPLAQAEPVFAGEESDVAVDASSHFSPDGNFVLLQRVRTFFTEDVSILRGARAERIAIPEDAHIQEVAGGHLLFLLRTQWRSYAPGSLLALKLRDGANAEPGLVYAPSKRASVQNVAAAAGAFYVSVLDNIKGRIYRVTRTDSRWRLHGVELPDNGAASILTSDPFAREVMIAYHSFLTPRAVYLLPGNDERPQIIKQLPERFRAENMTVEQFESRSADGAAIPYFVVHKTGVRPDGTTPTLLYGYGGFELAMEPQYLNEIGKVWVERGGIYVLANIRGGGEFGPDWHKAVLKENRPKVFQDFISVAEDLVRRKFTSPAHLGIAGGSNGGLLVGATFVQRPDLFRAVFCAVPLLDMLRYHKLLAGNSWMAEYGDPEDPKVGPVIRSYSPYQNVQKGARYPRVFFYTSTKDDRVHPGHARKMVAKMEAQGHEVLYYENTEGGHSASANLEQRVKQVAMEYTYLFQELQGPAPQ